MKCDKKESALVFLDQNNLFHRFKKLDFKKLLNVLKKDFNILRACSYNAYDYTNETQKKFITYLSNSEWKCKTVDSNVQTNIDNILACDIIIESASFKPDWIVLISCDGDFAYALDECSKKGIKVLVIGAKNNISLELLKTCDKHLYIEDLGDGIILETN